MARYLVGVTKRTPTVAPAPANDRVRPGFVLVLLAIAIGAAVLVAWAMRGEPRASARAMPAAAATTQEPPQEVLALSALPAPPPAPARPSASAPPPPPPAESIAAPAPSASSAPAASFTDMAAAADEHLAAEAARCVTKRDRETNAKRITLIYMLHVEAGNVFTSDVSVNESDLGDALEACVVERIRNAKWSAPGAANLVAKRAFDRRVMDFVFADGG
jgi:hypothetical protein